MAHIGHNPWKDFTRSLVLIFKNFYPFFGLYFISIKTIILLLSLEHSDGLSGANPHETRKLDLLPQAKVPKSSGSEWGRWSRMSVFAKDIPTQMLVQRKIGDNYFLHHVTHIIGVFPNTQ